MPERPFVSVIIPVYNDGDRLSQCLTALHHQTYPFTHYEIIVVDNNSTDDIRSICDRFPKVCYGFESKPGAYAARNHGVRISRGDLIAFTDTDCVPSPGWIGQGVAVLQWAALVAGRIEFTFQGKTPNPVEYADSVFHLQQWTYVQQGYAATGNAFTWRWVFDEVGLFDERLRHLGDRQWGQRVCAAGYAIAYAPHAWVAHPARSTLSALMGKVRGQARAMDSLKPYTVSTLIQQLLPFGHRFYQFVLGDGQPWSLKLSFVAIAHLIKYVVAWEMVLALGSRRAPDSSEPSPHGSSRGLPGRGNLGSLPQPHDAP